MILFLNCLLVVLVVVIHYEVLHQISILMPKLRSAHRFRIIFCVAAALFAHAVEVWLYALAYYVLHIKQTWGQLTGGFDGSLSDSVYFSITTYTTLGFGDIAPTGPMRYIVGMEALIGLVLIAWTASFLYYEIQRQWQHEDEP